MALVELIGEGRARVTLPGLAAQEYDGGSVGQAASARRGAPSPEEANEYEAWSAARTVRAGRGWKTLLEADAETLDDFRVFFEAQEMACAQGEEPAAAYACKLAVERIDQALRALKEES